MMRTKTLIVLVFVLLCNMTLEAQTITQTVKGKVVDKDSQAPIVGANIVIEGTNPVLGEITDAEGYYKLPSVPVGRYTIKISFIGYKPIVIPEVMITSGKELVLDVELTEDVESLDEIIVNGRKGGEALNSMTMVSGRSITTEQTHRFAGGLDDPSRLVSAFAGVSTDGDIESNAIMIRGNASTGVLWQIEGVEVPTPSHFSNAEVLGGGAITLFSNNMLATSDFFTGAFPAEYGNATSGVFDMKLRTGNNEKYEHAAQAGIMGLDFSSEGPFKKGKKASYLFNYRYSTLGLVKSFLPEEGLPVYQDLCYKLNFPTKKAGTFTFWGIGGLSNFDMEPLDEKEWNSLEDRRRVNADFTNGTTSLKHKILLGNSYLQTAITATANTQDTKEDLQLLDKSYEPSSLYNFVENRYSIKSFINHKFGSRHTNRTGVNYTYVSYDYKMLNSDLQPLHLVADSKGETSYWQAFTQSKINITSNLSLTAGLHALYLNLNDKSSIDPRVGLKWKSNVHTFSAGYGIQSQVQYFNIYFIERENNGATVLPNKNLDLLQAQHFVLGYEYQVNPSTYIKIEPYFQVLSNIPVVENSSVAIVNIPHFHTFDEVMISTGEGRNYGVDITLERKLAKGFYYMVTGSIFESKYKGDDGVERNTAYNNKYVVNLLAGKEWKRKKNPNNIFGASGRLYLKGGNRISPVDEQASVNFQDVVTDDTRAFEDARPGFYRTDISLYYRRNKPKYSTLLTLQINNVLASPIYYNREFNYQTNQVEKIIEGDPFPSLSYKIEF